ncbi:sulfatase [Palleronia sp. LCG004]|uniref:sulfatase n=1 Tax=Palleronia sp. LCG004 TaxID=3079304 RepID=UPI002943AB01|nr:sulfatase [Palleronia sp. LCG004]WOI57294.1 sulfatase [Palleronia sp. LCG004]
MGRIFTGFAVALSLFLLHLAIVMPSHPAGLTIGRFLRPTWELPVVIIALASFRGSVLRGIVVFAAASLIVLRAADLGTYMAFSRPFNPLLDLHLLVSGWDLLAASIGRLAAIATLGGAGLTIMALAVVLWLSLARAARSARACRIAAALPVLALAASFALPGSTPFFATPVVAGQIARISRGVADLTEFTAALDSRPSRQPEFAALEGHDVVLAFVESYGRTFLDDPEFRALSRPRLQAIEARLADAGWSVASGWVAAPTRGGQSWLSHATFLSGLRVDSQIRHDRLMTSSYPSLNGDFGAAGWRTGAAMPAITLDWPEAGWYGYDMTLDAHTLGYRGKPFEWVTMPDQYTWSAMDRLLRGPGADMIEMALVTSHAPWTPLPEIVEWDAIGDGSIFDGTRRTGGTPREVWSDPARIRSQYALSLNYALEVTGQYIARQGADAVFFVLGDHQPAPLLTGQDAPPDVPIHVIAEDPTLLDRLPAQIFSAGMFPDPGASVIPMEDMRALIVDAFDAN